MRRILITARNSSFPFLSDGITRLPADRAVAGSLSPVHSVAHTAECSATPAAPPDCVGGGRRALLHLRSLTDGELAEYARTIADPSDLELEMASRILNLLDALEEAQNTYKENDE